LITTSATADDLSTLGRHVFMMLPPNSQQGSDQANYALSKFSAKKAAILYRQNPYGETLRTGFSKTFQQSGGTITADLGFPDGEEDFLDRLRRIKATNPDVVFIPVHDADTGRILRQAKEINFPASVRFLGADGCMSDTALKLAGEAGEGAIFSNVASISKTFDEKYRSAHGEEPSPYAASAYDTVRIVAQLATSGAKTSDDFQRGLVEMAGFDGATGTTRFSTRDKSYWALSKPYRQFEIKSGKFVLVP
jgi:branched-chain amino acid transport system substrate-binding protein